MISLGRSLTFLIELQSAGNWLEFKITQKSFKTSLCLAEIKVMSHPALELCPGHAWLLRVELPRMQVENERLLVHSIDPLQTPVSHFIRQQAEVPATGNREVFVPKLQSGNRYLEKPFPCGCWSTGWLPILPNRFSPSIRQSAASRTCRRNRGGSERCSNRRGNRPPAAHRKPTSFLRNRITGRPIANHPVP